MKRRDLLTGAVAGGLLAACSGGESSSGGGPAHTGKKVRWRLASSFPRTLDTIYGAAEVMADRVREMSGGNFDIKCYPAGELVPGLEVLDAVQQGTVPIGQSASYYYIGKNPALAFDTCVPFGMTARQQSAWLLEGGGLELVNELYADFGVRAIPGGNTGVQMGGWFVPEVNAVDDLKGLKMRIPGMGGRVMEALGVSTQTIAGGEIYAALERGAIDATDWVGPYDDEKLGFHKVAKNYYYPGWWEPGPSLSFFVNQKEWDALPAEYQAILQTACHEGGLAMQTRYDAKNPAAMQRLLAGGVTTRAFSPEILAAAKEASEQMLAEGAAADAGYKKIYESFKAFRDASNAWSALAERAYHDFAYKA
ncbi:MAG: ABC transporter substrate-binding protein [Deltaproteobacteria bacterium]|nr:MAG: ABC transporter substrate-binding protein [Deltaproteobacteria bacterium]